MGKSHLFQQQSRYKKHNPSSYKSITTRLAQRQKQPTETAQMRRKRQTPSKASLSSTNIAVDTLMTVFCLHQQTTFQTLLPTRPNLHIKGGTARLFILFALVGVIAGQIAPQGNCIDWTKEIEQASLKKIHFAEGEKIDPPLARALRHSIATTPQKIPGSEQVILPVMRHPKVNIILTDSPDYFPPNTAKHDATFAHTLPAAHLILMHRALAESHHIGARLIYHESIHMFNALLHKTPRCYEENDLKAITPVYPVTQNNMKQYENALLAGEKQLKKFNTLRKKEQKKALSPAEKITLQSFRDATTTCLLEPFEGPIPEALAKQVEKKGAVTVDLQNPYGGGLEKVKILAVKQHKGVYWGTIIPTQQDQVVFFNHKNAKDTLAGPRYAHLDCYTKLAELETHLLQSLSLEAFHLFYPQASRLRNAYIKQCADDTLQPPKSSPGCR